MQGEKEKDTSDPKLIEVEGDLVSDARTDFEQGPTCLTPKFERVGRDS
jgi:hypothetical protein